MDGAFSVLVRTVLCLLNPLASPLCTRSLTTHTRVPVCPARPAPTHCAPQRMKTTYTELLRMNEELIGEYTKRANNHSHLMMSLKMLNDMIQRASNLRFGTAKTAVVSACRKAIKKSNLRNLIHIMSEGAKKR